MYDPAARCNAASTLAGACGSPARNTIEVNDNDQSAAADVPEPVAALRSSAYRGDRSEVIREAFQDIQFTMAAHSRRW